VGPAFLPAAVACKGHAAGWSHVAVHLCCSRALATRGGTG
jgi:hypothetical protein